MLTVGTHHGNAPVHLAAQQGHCDIILALLRAGTSVGLRDAKEGGSPLHHAARHGKSGAIISLVQAGASPAACDSAGQQPLHWACDYEDSDDHATAAALLLRLGADPHARDHSGRRAIDLASNKPKVRQALLAAHACI